jgi:hypothetical protein
MIEEGGALAMVTAFLTIKNSIYVHIIEGQRRHQAVLTHVKNQL